jgi:uncharacterized protein YjbJ (UPF0337 family)
MDENRVEGRAGALKGGIKEGFGQAVGDVKTEREGKLEGIKGDVQDMYGQARDSVVDAAYAAGRQATSFEDSLRHSISAQPYLAVGIALAIGIALGRLSARYQDPQYETRRIYRY